MPLYKFSRDDVRVRHPETREWCVVNKKLITLLGLRGLLDWSSHEGDGEMLAPGVTWDEFDAELDNLMEA